MVVFLLSVIVTPLLSGCVSRPDPAPATMSTEPPPWTAPRDAISYIAEAGLPELALNADSDPFIVTVLVTVDAERVALPPFIGIDRLRAVQAPVHTHDDSGDVWLEGEGNREVTLGDFFTVWGVRFDDGCLGNACTRVEVSADGQPVSDPASLLLRGHDVIEVSAQS